MLRKIVLITGEYRVMSEKVELSRQQQKSKETKEKIFQAAKTTAST